MAPLFNQQHHGTYSKIKPRGNTFTTLDLCQLIGSLDSEIDTL